MRSRWVAGIILATSALGCSRHSSAGLADASATTAPLSGKPLRSLTAGDVEGALEKLGWTKQGRVEMPGMGSSTITAAKDDLLVEVIQQGPPAPNEPKVQVKVLPPAEQEDYFRRQGYAVAREGDWLLIVHAFERAHKDHDRPDAAAKLLAELR